MRKCNNCQRSTFDTANFCHHCGAKMNQETAKNIFEDVAEDAIEIEETAEESSDQPIEERIELPQAEPEITIEPVEDIIEETPIEIEFEIENETPPTENKIEETLTCPNCNAENSLEAKICTNCSLDFYAKQPPAPPASPKKRVHNIFENNPNENVEQEIAEYFTEFFEETIKSEHNTAKYNRYVDRFYESDFKIGFEYRIRQLAEEIQKWRLDLTSTEKREKLYLRKAFGELIDYFIVRYCEDLNEIQLPEAALKYQNMPLEDIDLSQMIYDYLQFEMEDEKVYTDFLKMPLKKLKNASAAFLYPEKGERILFICDQSVLGNCKEGFAMTENAIYWKMPFESAERVYYRNIESVIRQAEWITINGMFFNVNKSVNFKLLKVLKKLKELV